MKKIKNLAIIVLMTAFLIILSIKVEATTGKVNSETVRLRKEPNTKSTILEQLDKGDEVEVLEQEEGWYKVIATIDDKKITGYISEKLLDVEGNINSSNSEEEQPEDNQTTNTPNNEQNPSEEPQENNEQTPEEVPVDTVSPEQGVTIEENKEYELKKLINTKILPLINSMNKGTIESGNVKVVEMINDWCKIENTTQDGWIRVNMLKKSISDDVTTSQPETNEPSQPTVEPSDPNTTKEPETTPTNATIIKRAYVSTESLKVREEPNTSSKVIDSLIKNNQVSILEELDGWYKIKIGGKIGYVSSKYISDKKVEETTSRGGNTERTPDTTTTTPENTTQPENVKSEETTNNTTTSSKGTEIVEFAKKYLGYKYVSGGASPSTGFDCSGFTSYVYKQFGVSLYRTSRDQIKNGTAVSKSELQPGDLLVFNGESNKSIGHVGIYIGDGNFIHASNPKGGVKITALSSSYYASRYVGARRVI